MKPWGWTVTDENGVCLHCKADNNQIGRLKGRIQELEKECADWKQDFDAEIGFRKKDAEKIAHLESKLKSAQAVVEAARTFRDRCSIENGAALSVVLKAYDAQTRSGGE